jgi:uncharacterized protein (TIGR02145 family)
MLFLTTVTDWKGVGRNTHIISKETGTPYVFDINNVTNLRENGAGSRFTYAVGATNRKTGHEEVFCNTPYLTVKQEFDILPLSNTLELSVYPNNDLTKVPFTTYIDIHDFCYAWSHNPYPQYTWLVYSAKGSGEKRILVDMTLSELLQLDNQFDENNVQWFTFVDPLEEIHPTWFIRVPGLYDVDGNWYDEIVIGTQTWMLNNLKTTKYRDGTPILNLTANGDWITDSTGAYCWYNNDIGNKNDYGGLYDWYAINNAHGLAPVGWRIPTRDDFNLLNTYLGDFLVAGGKLKEIGLTHWNTPNTSASNSSLFTAVAGGQRLGLTGAFSDLLNYAIFGTSTEDTIDLTKSESIVLYYNTAWLIASAYDKHYGFSIRCIKE